MRTRWNIKLQVYIDLEKVRQNIESIRSQLQAGQGKKCTRLMLMLKADAYGLGLEEVAKATEDLVDGFGVVTLEEAVKLRKICRRTPILANYVSPNEIQTAVENGIDIGLSNDQQLEKILSLASRHCDNSKTDCKELRSKIKCSIAVDSGMHRLGFDLQDVDKVCKALKGAGVEPASIYSHFGDHYECQKERFDTACRVTRWYLPNIKRHIASSHQLKDASVYYDCVRVGLSAYIGAVTVKSRVIATRQVEGGEYVGYGDYKTESRANIAVVFGGYADGIDREKFVYVYARGKRYNVIGVCMDTFIIDTQGDLLTLGEEVTLVDENTIVEQAKTMQTIPYTLLTCWMGRTDKIYV